MNSNIQDSEENVVLVCTLHAKVKHFRCICNPSFIIHGGLRNKRCRSHMISLLFRIGTWMVELQLISLVMSHGSFRIASDVIFYSLHNSGGKFAGSKWPMTVIVDILTLKTLRSNSLISCVSFLLLSLPTICFYNVTRIEKKRNNWTWESTEI